MPTVRAILFVLESETVNEIILEETGFDMTQVHKNDLHKETQDEALSVMCFTPEPEVVQEETVPKSEFEKLMQSHRDEMQMLQEQYELVSWVFFSAVQRLSTY